MKEHPLTMKCRKCGESNRLPAVHCASCGAKLDFDAAEREIRRGGNSAGASLRRWLKLGVALALLAGVLLAIWPGTFERETGEDVDARRYRMQTELLLEALNRGLPAAQTLAARDVNAHLRELVAAQPPRRGWTAALEDAAVRFGAGEAEGFVSVGRGPFTLTAYFSARTGAEGLDVTGARLGHLPLPGALGRAFASAQGGMFRQLRNEARIWRNLDGARSEPGKLELLVKAGTP